MRLSGFSRNTSVGQTASARVGRKKNERQTYNASDRINVFTTECGRCFIQPFGLSMNEATIDTGGAGAQAKRKAMSDQPETVTFTKVVPIADADGKPIRVGSVLREINDGERGIVVRIYRKGDHGPLMCALGDVQIATGSGCSRMTNRYDQWRHIPREEQTYAERFAAWMRTPADQPTTLISESASPDAALAIDGIMALLPKDPVCWEDGPWPDTIEDALNFLAEHLTELSKQA